MSQTLVVVVSFVVLLAMVPACIKWIQTRSGGEMAASGTGARVISALAVGPQQRVVTVEVGPQDARTWLVLGVTAQSISCLHATAVRACTERLGSDAASVMAPRA